MYKNEDLYKNNHCLFACRAYTRYRTMKEVEVVLPKGLEMTKPGWDITKHQPETERQPPADEQLLLDKISETKHHSGDSSGCSSAQGSVTSSIDSGSHISSTSDSGTEHPRTPSGELRQRTVAPRSSLKEYNYMPTDNVSTEVWAAKNPPPGNYCVLGVDPNLPTDHSTLVLPDDLKNMQYISCDTAPDSAPYVITGEITKPVNPGYVPYDNPPYVEKNPGYVVAGNKTLVIPEKSYVQVAEVPGSLNKFNEDHTWSPTLDTSVNKSGYVSIGDASATQAVAEHTGMGYVPHRHFEGKTLKED